MNIVVQLVASLAWPIVVLVLALEFRRPLGEFVAELREISGFGVSARRGDKEVDRLAERIGKGVATTGDESRWRDATESMPAREVAASGGQGIPPDIFERFAYFMADYRIGLMKKETESQNLDTEACRLIAACAYRELLVYVRTLELLRQVGRTVYDVPLYAGHYAYRQAQKMGAPDNLVRDLRELKEFHKKLEDREVSVTPEGARTFATACRNTLEQLHAWRTGATMPTGTVFDRAMPGRTSLDGDKESQG